MALTGRQLRELRAFPIEGGNRVARAFQLAGVTQAQVAEAIGETQPYISDVARGRYITITVTKARKFAEYFGCTIEDLFPEPVREAQSA